MDSVAKALWLIEIELDSELTLDRIASTCGMSRFGLSRLFALGTGWPVMRYVRSRRLTCAAYKLAQGAPDILGVALEAGYGSHEAFTRAFHDMFGLTPEQVRARRGLDGLVLVEPIRMKEHKLVDIGAPRFEVGERLLIAGIGGRFTQDTTERIPRLWQTFNPYLGSVSGRVNYITYGVCCHPEPDGSFEYIAGVQVTRADRIPAEFRCVEVAPQRYAVFEHRGNLSTLHQTFYSIWNRWLPESGFKAADAPEFERYSEDFNVVKGTGVVEIWLPLQAEAGHALERRGGHGAQTSASPGGVTA